MEINKFLNLRKLALEKQYSNLNNMQQQAVFCTEGPLLILAGAGSGKTTTMVNRISYLIRFGNAYNSSSIPAFTDDRSIDELQNYVSGGSAPLNIERMLAVNPASPWQILAITFTNKAANELKDRLSISLGEDVARDVWASTFHSCCAKILRRFADRIGYSTSFTIYDTDDTKRLIKECQRQLGIDDKFLSHRIIANKISNAKNYLISPIEYERSLGENNDGNPLIAKVYRQYQSELKKADAMDFDDLIFNTVYLLETDSEVRKYYQNKFKYVMVDEYQDTNHAQFRLTQLLADGYGNICVVGDDDQSIYKFRGANIEIILGFAKQFNNCNVIRLEQNYRSTQNILDAANAVIAHNTNRNDKSLWTQNGRGEKLCCHLASNESDEAEYIVNEVSSNVRHGDFTFSDHAILYRANAQSNAIERMFARSGIPYRIFGAHRFYDRAEIRDAIAYLTLLNNLNDNTRLTRIINVPLRGIGTTTVSHVLDLNVATGRSCFDIICHADEYNILKNSANKLMKFANLISSLQDYVDELPLDELFDKLIDSIEYIEYLNKDPQKGQERIDNIFELKSNLKTYQEENGEGATLQGFLEEVTLMTDIDNYNEQADAVTLMTLHSAKGLEFPVVFIPGMEEGVFPGMSAVYDAAEAEEERRLAYVGITRAKKKLYLIHTEHRMLYGRTNRNQLSRFISEIPSNLIEKTKSRSLQMQDDAFVTRSNYSGKYNNFNNFNRNPQKPAPTAPKVTVVDFSIGQRVESPTFGKGTVLSCKKMGSDAMLEIAFDDVGTKKLMAKFAKLQAIKE